MLMPARYLSVVDVLLERLTEHEAAEAGVLRGYEEASDAAPDPAVRFLMTLILQDEKRHHRWMGAAVRSLFELRQTAEATSLPSFRGVADSERLLEQTEAFLEAENQALYLGVELTHSPSTAAWIKDRPLELLVGMMREDTQRHIRILQNIKARLRRHRNGNAAGVASS
jgi:rubrerythrin